MDITKAALAAAALLAATAPAGAAPEQFEWAQDYAAVTRAAELPAPPILSAETYAATQRAASAFREAAARGGWRPVAGAEGLRLGAKGPAVAALRRRLAVSGDLSQEAGEGQVFDAYAKAGVQRFQARHGLFPSGTVNAATAAALNVPAEVRLRQLEANVVRLGSYQVPLGTRYVNVNLPGALMETVEGGRVASRHAAGVGKVDRQSPIMNAKATAVNFNPFWYAPASIVRKDLIPRMRKDPGYLARSRIRILDGEREVAPGQVDWSGEEAVRYRFRQDPGADVNAMGFVRIDIPNPHGVYMHDTPDKGVYRDDWRFISSGCVRVQNVRGYVAWLLRGTPGWDERRIAETIESGARVDAPLLDPVPVYWTYITAWAAPDGTVSFRDDIYGKDPGAAPTASEPSPYGRVVAVPAPASPASAPSPYGRVEASAEPPQAAPGATDEADVEAAPPAPPAEVGEVGDENP